MTIQRAFPACLAVVCLAIPAAAADFYISSAGHDGQPGTSPGTAWRTIARANAAVLADGDRLLFEGGQTFAGNLTFDTRDGGTAMAPLVVTSYGTGRATLASVAGHGVIAYNRAALRIANIHVAGAHVPGTSGIVFYTDAPGTAALAHVRIADVEVSGFGSDGIQIGAWGGAPGFADVRITRVVARDNDRTGILTFADRANVHRDVYVGYSTASANRGIPGSPTNSGSGIVFGGVAGGTIERSVAHGNGALSTAAEGPVGIWAYDSTRVIIQHNESYGNRTGGPADGGGFDLDQNVSDSILQFNYSHDNDGAGYLLAHRHATDHHANNTIRFNVSHGDGRRNGYAAIEVWGRTVGARIHHNTVVMPAVSGATGAAFALHNSGIGGVRASGVAVFDNILQSERGLLVDVSADQLAAAPLRLNGNVYHAASGFTVRWGAASVGDLAGLRSLGQESWDGTPTGTAVDPRLATGAGAVTLGDASRLDTLQAYRLDQASPVAGAGFDATLAGVDPGQADFYGMAPRVRDPGASSAGAVIDTGDGGGEAPDAEVVIHAGAAPLVAGDWRVLSDPAAAGGAMVVNANAGLPKAAAAAAQPADYVEWTFTAAAGRGYRLWLRGRAARDSYENDSVFVQFDASIDATGNAVYRIGTTSATTVTLEDCVSCGLSGWGWQDNGFGLGVLGPLIYFAHSGPQTIRLQRREDGIAIDQIVLSSGNYLQASPGALKHDAIVLPASAAEVPQPPTAPDSRLEVVLRAAEEVQIFGDWEVVADATAAAGARLQNPNRHAPKLTAPLAEPPGYVELSFEAVGGVPYRLWIRGKAAGNDYQNDSVFVQFSAAVDGAGRPLAIGTTAAMTVTLEDCAACGLDGWGWQDNGFGAGVLGPLVVFAASGPQRLRIQPREDGLAIDQIVLSAARYLMAAPGAVRNDGTILAR